MYEALLDEFIAHRRRQGYDLQPPATDAQVADLRKRVRQQLRYGLPDGYAAFLKRTNGMEFNGLRFYATEASPVVGFEQVVIPGLVEGNLEWRQGGSYRDQIIFGHTGDANYVFHQTDEAFQVRMQPTDSVLETLGSIEELLFYAMDEHRP